MSNKKPVIQSIAASCEHKEGLELNLSIDLDLVTLPENAKKILSHKSFKIGTHFDMSEVTGMTSEEVTEAAEILSERGFTTIYVRDGKRFLYRNK